MCQRVLAEVCCCLDIFFLKGKLKQKGYLTVKHTVDPQILIWENLGISKLKYIKYLFMNFIVLGLIFGMSFGGQYYMSNIQKDLTDMVKSDCTGESQFNIDKAWLDVKLDPK